jgi:hypothetical protein
MQRANFQQATITQVQTQASRVLPGHGTGMEESAINDDVYHDDNSLLHLVLSVLANMMGGALMLGLMFVLPFVVAGLLS